MVRAVTDREGSLSRAQAGLELFRNRYRAEIVIPQYIQYYREIVETEQ